LSWISALARRLACLLRGGHDIVLVGYLARVDHAECRRCGLRWRWERAPVRCAICGRPFDPGEPGRRAFTCSDECHGRFVDKLVEELGEYKKVVDVHTGKAYRVPARHIIEHGLRYEDLPRFPEWEEGG